MPFLVCRLELPRLQVKTLGVVFDGFMTLRVVLRLVVKGDPWSLNVLVGVGAVRLDQIVDPTYIEYIPLVSIGAHRSLPQWHKTGSLPGLDNREPVGCRAPGGQDSQELSFQLWARRLCPSCSVCLFQFCENQQVKYW